MQTEFLNLVQKSRNISSSTLELVSDGRIVTGKQAKDLKLIDAVGTENDALSWLKKEAGVDDDVEVAGVGEAEEEGNRLCRLRADSFQEPRRRSRASP